MTTDSDSKTAGPAKRQSGWFGIGILLIIVLTALLFFLVGTRVMLHRYHRGNFLNQPATAPPPPKSPVEP